jgi:hypothetical protein
VALAPEQLDFFRDMEQLVGSHGWGRLERALNEELADLRATALTACKTTEDLAFRRGMVEVLERMVRFPETIHAQREAAEVVASPAAAGGNIYEE